MKKSIALAVMTFASQAVVIFAGEPMVSSKQVIAPPPPPPPEFFRPNEFDIGAFGTYATGVGSEEGGLLHGWGGGIDLTYWFPWKYAGVRFQGTGLDVGTGNGSQTREVTLVRGFAPGGENNVAAGVLTGDFMLRLPLDDFWPAVHLAPYFFAGLGAIIPGGDNGGEGHSVSETFTVTNSAGETREVAFTGRRINTIRNEFGPFDRVLGHFGGGLEYRFTPHIGLFGEAGYDIVNGARNNFIQTNFGLRYAF